MSESIRVVSIDDSEEVAELWQRNRKFLAPWEPVRQDSFYDLKSQRDSITRDLEEFEAGRMVPFVICGSDLEIVGKLNLNGVTRGAFQSAAMGYWVSEHANGLGHATAAARAAVAYAFETLNLHRVQAETLLHNTPSQHVLRNAGFSAYGVAPDYLRIAGRWQDHILFNTFSPDWHG